MSDYQTLNKYKNILLDTSEALASTKSKAQKLAELEKMVNGAFGFNIVESDREVTK